MYPEPRTFGEIPAYGFFIRHVNRLELNGVEVSYLKEDFRSPFLLQNVSQAKLIDVNGQHASGVPALVLRDVDGLKIRDYPFRADTSLNAVKDQKF
ncbi:MAG TPA: hypothetical protein VFB14_28725 [Bryobacteraceae bacterium]|jgi:hypothetical protein|nr:hypothetical protein [Bryobacteraceae bacterium]